MPLDNPDFKAIAAGAKKTPAYKAMKGNDEATEPGDSPSEDAGEEDTALGEAFAAVTGNDEAGFKTAMAAAMRACYESMKK